MLPISATELASLRAELNSTFPDLATVLRKTVSSNGRGGQTTSYVAQTPQIACIVTIGTTTDRNPKKVEHSQQVAVTTWTVKLPFGSSVAISDRLLIGSTTYEIFDTVTPARSLQLADDYLCRAVE
jgi:hypothetical protein